MLVLFLNVVFSSITVECQNIASNAKLKTQLQKSLLHVNAMLADIEGKIEKERKILSRMDYDLNYKDKAGFLDYEVTDIWWQTTNKKPTTSQATPLMLEDAKKATRSMFNPKIRLKQKTNQTVVTKTNSTLLRDVSKTSDVNDIVSDWVHSKGNSPIQTSGTNDTFPNSLFEENPMNIAETSNTIATTGEETPTPGIPAQTPLPLNTRNVGQSLPPGVPPGWPNEATTGAVPTPATDKPYVQKLKSTMAEDRHGYFTAAFTKFLEIVATKDVDDLNPILKDIPNTLGSMLQDPKYEGLGQDLKTTFYLLFAMQNIIPVPVLRKKAAVASYAMKDKKVLVPEDVNHCLDSYDEMFTHEEGEALFLSLEDLEKFPDGGKGATRVTHGMIVAALTPFLKIQGTLQHKQFLSAIHQAIQEQFPHWRANSEGTNSTDDKSKIILESGGIPSRRRMQLPSYKKIMQHLISKHPKLFKKYYKHYKHNRQSTRHSTRHRTARSKHHHTSHKKHRKQKKILRAHAPVSKKAASHKIGRKYQDSCESDAYYREHVTKAKRFVTKSRTKKRFHNITILPSKLNSINAEYIRKEIAKYVRANKKRITFRKSMTESSENKMDNHSQNAIITNVLHKIREASSYSDEEDNLKSNLYDALRHGNRTFAQFRALDINTTNKQTFSLTRDSSSDPDDEWVLKNNIYKVFEQ